MFPETPNILSKLTTGSVVNHIPHPQTSYLRNLSRNRPPDPSQVQTGCFVCQSFNHQEMFLDAIQARLVWMRQVVLQQ